jgi:membrane associated rhomboid family serine protease
LKDATDWLVHFAWKNGQVTANLPQDINAAPICYRHPDREGHVRCRRCQRHICPDCMRDASVGHQCVECAGAGQVHVRKPGLPVITYGLIALNVVMFVLQKSSVVVYQELVTWTPGIARGEVYRLLTGAFLHSGIPHLLFNMWALYVVGPALEAYFGRLRFIALYLLSALGGGVLVYLLTFDVPTVGASGAIFGLFGATVALSRLLNLDMRWVVGLIALNLVFTFAAPQISWQGHIGGLITGAAVGAAYAYAPPQRKALVQVGISIAVVLIFVALVYLRTISLLAGAV